MGLVWWLGSRLSHSLRERQRQSFVNPVVREILCNACYDLQAHVTHLVCVSFMKRTPNLATPHSHTHTHTFTPTHRHSHEQSHSHAHTPQDALSHFRASSQIDPLPYTHPLTFTLTHTFTFALFLFTCTLTHDVLAVWWSTWVHGTFD